jgi:hypothetical protein
MRDVWSTDTVTSVFMQECLIMNTNSFIKLPSPCEDLAEFIYTYKSIYKMLDRALGRIYTPTIEDNSIKQITEKYLFNYLLNREVKRNTTRGASSFVFTR